MKSTVSNTPCKAELPFPKLMIDKEDGEIILFQENGKGVIVKKGATSNRVIGDIVVRPTTLMAKFRDFNGSVCLENGDN